MPNLTGMVAVARGAARPNVERRSESEKRGRRCTPSLRRMTTTIDFQGRVQRIGDRTLVRLPAGASGKLSSRGQVAVEATLNGHGFDAVVEPDGRKGHWLPIEPALPRSLGLTAGDAVTVELAPARDWPEPELPGDLKDALSDASDLAEVWSDITPMARWEWVRWVNATRNPETRERRVEVSISKLRSGKRRPCCFDLASCTDPEVSRSGKLIEPA